MEHSGKLTVQQICDLHCVLMKGLREDAGEIRKCTVFTSYGRDRDIHVHPESAIAEQILYACVARLKMNSTFLADNNFSGDRFARQDI